MALEHGMIEPFVDAQVRAGVVSYGLSSYGYDIRVADEFKVFTNINTTVIDPKNFDPRSFVDVKADVCIVPPNSFALAHTVEYFRIPRDVLTVCLGKSTYARCGIIVNVTPFEPEWEGTVTLEISNTTPLPAKIYANEGIAQVIFFQSDDVVRTVLRRQERQVLEAARGDAAEDLMREHRRLRPAAAHRDDHDRARRATMGTCPNRARRGLRRLGVRESRRRLIGSSG